MIDIRCPRHPVRLLLRIGKPMKVDGANLIEIACRDCRNDARRTDPTVSLVLHRYNVVGELVETVVER
jgi:hypothetical protein